MSEGEGIEAGGIEASESYSNLSAANMPKMKMTIHIDTTTNSAIQIHNAIHASLLVVRLPDMSFFIYVLVAHYIDRHDCRPLS